MDRPPHRAEPEEALPAPSGQGRRPLVPRRVRGTLRRSTNRALANDPLWSVLFVVVVTAVLGGRGLGTDGGTALVVGRAAPRDVALRAMAEVEDESRTASARREAELSVPEVYVHDAARAERMAQAIRSAFEEGRSGASEARVAGPAGAALSRARFSPELEGKIAGAVAFAMSGLVVGNRALVLQQPSILVLHVPGKAEERLSDYASILDLDGARSLVRDTMRARMGTSSPDTAALAEFAASFVDANLAYAPETTASRRAAAAASVPAVRAFLPKGTILVHRGETVTAAHLDALGKSRGPLASRARGTELAGLVVVASLLAFFLRRYARHHQRQFRKVEHLHALLVVVLLSMLLLAQATLGLSGVAAGRFDGILHASFVYLVPVAAGSILVALLANGRIAMVYSTFFAVLFCGLNGWDAYRMLWALLTQWIGIYAITTYRERAALLRAGIVVGGAGAVAALSVEAIRHNLEPIGDGLYAAGLSFLGGAFGVGLLVSFSLPLLESVFHVLTDIRLLELSNLNNPLLSELAVKAPGSYSHSLIVGRLAEEGAKAIGANSLFCRVAAFYHDIGKVRKPEYYVENQRGENPHERLTPSMSSLILSAHVKDGVRMAREAGLPEQIVDIIPQHHGTRVMTYFYEKAKLAAGPAAAEVHEDDFRYPGPKPRTREAAIFMLADAAEAAARTIPSPSPERIREMIRQIASVIVLDGQLDECDLTFSDLERIEEAFAEALASMHHQRVEYPGFDFHRGEEDRPRKDYRFAGES